MNEIKELEDICISVLNEMWWSKSTEKNDLDKPHEESKDSIDMFLAKQGYDKYSISSAIKNILDVYGIQTLDPIFKKSFKSNSKSNSFTINIPFKMDYLCDNPTLLPKSLEINRNIPKAIAFNGIEIFIMDVDTLVYVYFNFDLKQNEGSVASEIAFENIGTFTQFKGINNKYAIPLSGFLRNNARKAVEILQKFTSPRKKQFIRKEYVGDGLPFVSDEFKAAHIHQFTPGSFKHNTALSHEGGRAFKEKTQKMFDNWK